MRNSVRGGKRIGVGAAVLAWGWLGAQGGKAFAQTVETSAERPTDAPITDLADLSLENLLNISVSGASKYEQRADETAASISVVTSEEIRRHGYHTISDVVRAQRGFYISDDRYSHYLGVRGFSIPGDYNSRILLLIDGHRTNDALYDSAYATMGVEAIDRVEFIRGPSSSVYGSNAFFGVINVITKDGAKSAGILATGETSATTQHVSNYSNRGSLSVGHHWSNGLDVFVSGSAILSPGQKDAYFSEYDSPATNNGVAHRADGETGFELLAKGKYRHFTLTLHHYARDKHDPTASYASVFNDDRLVQADHPSFADLSYSRTFEPQGLTVLARTYVDTHTYDGYFPVDMATPPEPSTILMNRSHATARVVGGEFQLLWHLATNNRVLSWLNLGVGGDYQDRLRLWQKTYVETTPPSHPCSTTTIPARSSVSTRSPKGRSRTAWF